AVVGDRVDRHRGLALAVGERKALAVGRTGDRHGRRVRILAAAERLAAQLGEAADRPARAAVLPGPGSVGRVQRDPAALGRGLPVALAVVARCDVDARVLLDPGDRHVHQREDASLPALTSAGGDAERSPAVVATELALELDVD